VPEVARVPLEELVLQVTCRYDLYLCHCYVCCVISTIRWWLYYSWLQGDVSDGCLKVLWCCADFHLYVMTRFVTWSHCISCADPPSGAGSCSIVFKLPDPTTAV
jgi:hypothetical protein